jgi:two-component system, cell cycle response regulator DivK
MAHILLADDDPDMVEICQRLIPRRGHTLSIAQHAAEAIVLAASTHPDLILMDMRMPMSAEDLVNDRAGLEATRAIKANAACTHIPIVALTGHIMTNFRESIMEAGCCALLTKPIERFSDLLEMIERHLPAS